MNLPCPLPVLDEARTEFGFVRSRCGCPDCSVSCRHIPGFLVPQDLDRLLPGPLPALAGGVACVAIGKVPAAILVWALEHLLASPGALVAREEAGKLVPFRIPTLVPARQEDGRACHWLADDGACAVHDRAPFGCALCDSHLPPTQGGARSARALREVAAAHARGDLYAVLWKFLHGAGRIAPGPGASRATMAAEIGTLYPKYGGR